MTYASCLEVGSLGGISHSSSGVQLDCDPVAFEDYDIVFYRCTGEVTDFSFDENGAHVQCSTDWAYVGDVNQVVSDAAQSFDVSQLDPQLMAAYLGSGFFILLPLWAAAYGVKALIQTVKLR